MTMKDNEKLQEALRRVVEAFNKYGSHFPDCTKNYYVRDTVCSCGHDEALSTLTPAPGEVERLREALRWVDELRKRLPDPDFGEQRTTVKAIGDVIREALAFVRGVAGGGGEEEK